MQKSFISYISSIVQCLILLFGQGLLNGQNNAPAVEWNYSTPSTVSGFALDDNWAQSIIQTSDGNFVVAGFSDLYDAANQVTTARRHPAVFKYNPGRMVVWEKIPTHPSIPVIGGGGFTDLVEVTENNIKYIYACGSIRRTGFSGSVAVFGKFRLDNGNVEFLTEHAIGTNAVFFRLAPFPSATNPTSIFIAGKSTTIGDSSEKGTLFSLNTNGSLNTSFGNGLGFIRYNHNSSTSKFTEFRDISLVNSTSLILVGLKYQQTLESTCPRYQVKLQTQMIVGRLHQMPLTVAGHLTLNNIMIVI